MTYSPRPQPRPLSREQRAANHAHRDWQTELERLCNQGTDLLRAGRVEEFTRDWQPLIDAHRAAEPNRFATTPTQRVA